MNFFEKPKNQETPNHDTLNSGSSTLVLNSRQLSCLTAGLIAFLFFVFIGGYFLGQKNALERFSSQIDQDSLSDKIATSLYSMYDTTNEDESAEASEALEATEASEPEESSESNNHLEEQTAAKVADATPSKPLEISAAAKETRKNYYAELIGFGSEKAATDFIARLRKKGVSAMSKKLASRSAKGNSVAWYQVVTANYESYDTLVDVVAKIKREERLKSVRIITC